MVAVTTGTGLGLFNTSLNIIGSQTGNQNATLGRTGQGNNLYVNAATGNLIVQQHDEFIPALGLDFNVLRTYNSRGVVDYDNNDNWRLSVYRRLINFTGTRNAAGSTVTRVGQDGAETLFVYDVGRALYRNTDGEGAHDTIQYNAGTGIWVYTEGSSRRKETFTIFGQLMNESDADGNTTQYTYNTDGLVTQISQVSSGVTQTLYLDYTGRNLSQIRAVNGTNTQTRVRYAYDGLNRLTQVIVDLSPTDNSISDGKTYTTFYTYDGNSTRLASIIQGDGTRASFTYTLAGGGYKLATITDGLNRTTQYNYISSTQTDVVDPLGFITSYRYDSKGRLSEVLSPTVNAARLSTRYSYDSEDNLIQVIDPRGNATVYQYDANSNVILTRDAAGNTLTRTFSTTNQVLTETVYINPDPDGAGTQQPTNPLTTRFVYDNEDHLRFVISAQGRVTEHRYDAPGNRIASIQYGGGVYNLSGFGTTTALTETQLINWVATQDKTRTLRTDYTYEFHGLIASQTTYAKIASTGEGIRDGNETTTTTLYTASGDRWLSFDPAGNYTSEHFDGLGRRIRLQTGVAQTTLTEFDDANNRIITTLANGLNRTSVFNRTGELVSLFDSEAPVWRQDFSLNTDGLTSLHANYMALQNGRLRVSTRQLPTGSAATWVEVTGTRAHNFSDGMMFRSEVTTGPSNTGRNFMIGAVNTSAGSTATSAYRRHAAYFNAGALYASYYDPTDSVVPYKSILLSNAVKNNTTYIVEVVTSATGTTLYVYEQGLDRASGWQHSLSGQTWHRDWIGGMRSYMTTYGSPSSPVSDMFVDNLSESKPPLSQTSYSYDNNGRLRHSIDPVGARTYFLYDEVGRRIANIDSTGALTETVYNQNGQPSKTIRYSTRLTNAQLISLINANGTPANVSLASLRPTSGAADNRTQFFIYDSGNRLVFAVDEEGFVTKTVYDGLSRITDVIRYDTAVSTATWPAIPTIANVTVVENNNNDRRSRNFYDSDGRVIGALDSAGYFTEFKYNAAGQQFESIRYANAAIVYNTNNTINLTATQSLRNTGTFSAIQQNITAAGAQPGDQYTRQFYNARNQHIGTLDAEGYLTEFAYDRNGNRSQITRWANLAKPYSVGISVDNLRPLANPAQDQIARFTYDAANRLESETNFEGTTTVYQYDKLNNVVKTFTGLEAITEPNNITQTFMDGTQRVGVIADGKLITYDRDAGNYILREYHHHNAPQPALWSQDFSNNASTGLSGVTSPYFLVSGNRLNVTAQNATTPTVATVTGTRSHAINQNVIFRAEVTTSVSSTGRNILVGARSGTVSNRMLGALFDGDNLYAAYYDNTGTYRTTLLSSAAKPLKNNTAYVVEVQSRSTGVFLVVFERGKERYLAVSHYLGQSDWGTAQFVMQTQGFPGRVTNTTYVDNISEAKMMGRLLPGGLIAAEDVTTDTFKNYIYSSNGVALGRTTSDTRSLTNRYDLQGRLVGTLTGNGSAYLEQLFDNNAAATQAEIDQMWRSYGLTHSYDAAGRRTATTDQLGNTTHYVYDSEGRLRYTVTPADNGSDIVGRGEVTEMHYTAFGQVAVTGRYRTRLNTVGVTVANAAQELPQRIAALAQVSVIDYTYTNFNQRGAIKRFVDAEGKATDYAYNAFLQERSVVRSFDANNTLTRNFGYDQRGLLRSESQVGTGPNGAATRFAFFNTYDAFGRIIERWDGNFNAHLQSYDRLGRVITQTDPLQNIQRFSYDAFDRVLIHTDALNQQTRYIYNNTARSTSVFTPEGVITTTVRNRQGQTIEITDGRNNKTIYSYDRNGNLTRTTDAQGNSTTDYFTVRDELYMSFDKAGRFTVLTYDAASRVLTRTLDPYGLNLKTTYSYDALGRAVTVTDPNNVTTRTEYYNSGRVLRTSILGTNVSTEYTYDDQGNVLTVTEGKSTPEQRVTQYVYDTLGRRIREIVDPGVLKLTTRYEYDSNDNVVAKTEAVGTAEERITRYTYDANNRLEFTVDALGQVTRNYYDANGRVEKLQLYAKTISLTGLPTYVTRDQITSRLVADAVQDRISRYAYDKDGRRVFSIDALGMITERSFDANGNVIKSTEYAIALNATQLNTLDAMAGTNRITTIRNARLITPADQVQRTVYDSLNRAAFTIDALGYVTATSYDRVGNPVQQIAYAKALSVATIAALDANSANGMTTLSNAVSASGFADATADRITRTVYDNANRAAYVIDALGYVVRTQYDGVGRVTLTVVFNDPINVTTLPAQIRETDVITALAARLNPQQNKDQYTQYGYDTAGRLELVIDAESRTEYYTYDAVGNKKTFTNKRGAFKGDPAYTWTYEYDKAGRLIKEITPSVTVNRIQDFSLDFATGMAGLAGDGLTNSAAMRVDGGRLVVQTQNAATTAYPQLYGSRNYAPGDGLTFRSEVTTGPNSNGRWLYVGLEGSLNSTYRRHIASFDGSTLYAHWYDETDAANPWKSASLGMLKDNTVYVVEVVSTASGTNLYVYEKGTDRNLGFSHTRNTGWSSMRTTLWTLAASGRPVSTMYVDNWSELATVTRQESITTFIEYTALGDVKARTEAFGTADARTTRYEYDKLGRQIKTIYPQVGIYSPQFDSSGNQVVATQSTNIRNYAWGYDAATNTMVQTTGTSLQLDLSLLPDSTPTYVSARVFQADGTLVAQATTQVGSTVRIQGTRTGPEGTHPSFDSVWQQAVNWNGQINLGLQALPPGKYRVVINASDQWGRDANWHYHAFGQPAGYYTNTHDNQNESPETWHKEISLEVAVGTALNDGDRPEYINTPVATIGYDSFGNAVANRDAAGGYFYKVYDTLGRLKYDIDAERFVTEYFYDAFGNQTTIIRYATPINESSFSAKEQAGVPPSGFSVAEVRAILVGHAQDRVITNSYDQLNRVIETREPLVFTFDSSAAAAEQYFSVQPITRNEYNAFGQVIRQRTLQNGASTNQSNWRWLDTYYFYTKSGDKIGQIDALGYLTTWQYDASGNVTREIQYAEALTYTTATTLSVAGTWNTTGFIAHTRVPDPALGRNRQTQYTYDRLNRRTSEAKIDIEFQQANYGGVPSVTNRVGDVVTEFSFDAVGNATQVKKYTRERRFSGGGTSPPIIIEGESVRTQYDALGRAIAVAETTRLNEDNQLVTPLTSLRRDIFGNVVQQTRFANGTIANSFTPLAINPAVDRTDYNRYDALGRVVSTLDAMGSRIEFSYDALGRIRKRWQIMTNVDGVEHMVVNRYVYDRNGRQINTVDVLAIGNEINNQVQYNGFGEIILRGVNNNFQERFEYDNAGRLWRTNQDDGIARIYFYNLQGQTTAEIRSMGRDLMNASLYPNAQSVKDLSADIVRTNTVYDHLGRVVSQQRPWFIAEGVRIDPVIRQSVDRWGNVIALIDPRSSAWVTRYRYNELDKNIEEIKPTVAQWQADSAGNMIWGGAVGTPIMASPTTRYAYDAYGRRVAVTDANGNTTMTRYDQAGNAVAEYDAYGIARREVYNALNLKIASVDAGGRRTESTYDRNDRLIHQRNAAWEDTYYRYDELGNQIQVTDGEGKSTRYLFDTRKHLTATRLAMGQETYATYDTRGRKISERYSFPADNTVWTYDYFGRLLNYTDSNIIVDSHITTPGSISLSPGSIRYEYTYNNLGQVVTQKNFSNFADNRGAGQNLLNVYYENGSLREILDLAENSQTFFSYDALGNRTRERFSKFDTAINANRIYQDVTVSYDALGRQSRYNDASTAAVSDYLYDAVGNRRRTTGRITTGSETWDYWYLYDANNRLTISQGVLNGSRIGISLTAGTSLTYDAIGNRTSATFGQSGAYVTEYYDYDAVNRLRNSYRLAQGGGAQLYTTSRQYDRTGKTVRQFNYSSPGVLRDYYINSYNDNGWLYTQETYVQGVRTTRIEYTFQFDGRPTTYAVIGFNSQGGLTSRADYMYGYVKKQGSYKEKWVNGLVGLQRGSTNYFYDKNGGLVSIDDMQSTSKDRTFITNTRGQILRKTENGKTQYYHYINGESVGSHGGLAPVDFDYNYTPISDQYPPSTPSSYTVALGDTLKSIAQAVYGDAKLWYIIADANGLGGDADLYEGHVLTIPNSVTNIHNDYTTVKPYNAGKIIGDTTPTIPDPPPPPAPKKKGCGVIGQIIMVIVAVVVTFFTAGALGPAMGALLGTTFGPIAAGMVGAAVGNIASQLVGMATGNVEEFSWRAVATAALSAGLTGGVSTTNFTGMVVNGIKSNLVSQGINIATGQQERFSWRSLAIAAIAAPLAQKVNKAFGVEPSEAGRAISLDRLARNVGAELVNSSVRQGISIAINRGGRMDWAQVAADGFGNGIGNAIVDQLKFNKSEKWAEEQWQGWERDRQALEDDHWARQRFDEWDRDFQMIEHEQRMEEMIAENDKIFAEADKRLAAEAAARRRSELNAKTAARSLTERNLKSTQEAAEINRSTRQRQLANGGMQQENDLIPRVDLGMPSAKRRETYIGPGNRDVETGEFSKHVLSKDSLRETQRNRFSTDTDVEFDIWSYEDKNTLFEKRFSQTQFGDSDFGVLVGPHAKITESRKFSLSVNTDGLDFSANRGIKGDITYYSGRMVSDNGEIEFGLGSVAEANYGVQSTVGYSREKGLSFDANANGGAGFALIKAAVTGTLNKLDLGLVNVQVEGALEGHAGGAGIYGSVGLKTVAGGVRGTIGAGLVAGVGGKGTLSAEVTVAPRVYEWYNTARLATTDFYERVLTPSPARR